MSARIRVRALGGREHDHGWRPTLRFLCCLSAMLLVACGVTQVDEGRDSGTWRLEFGASLAAASEYHARIGKSWSVAERKAVADAIAETSARPMSAYEVTLGANGVGSFRYMRQGEPTVSGHWRPRGSSHAAEIQLELEQPDQSQVTANAVPTLLYLRWEDGRYWVNTVGNVWIPLSRIRTL